MGCGLPAAPSSDSTICGDACVVWLCRSIACAGRPLDVLYAASRMSPSSSALPQQTCCVSPTTSRALREPSRRFL
jgi:hypothetical protein